jgi:hypothetical protein
LAVVSGCSTTVQVHARFPANNAEAAQLRKVAVADFEGREGDHFAYALEAMLANADFDGMRYFTMMDGGSRDRGVEASEASRFGRAIGADGVYFGRMQAVGFDEFPYEDRDTRCVEKDDNGKCTRHKTFTRPCVRRAFHMEVYPMLVNVRSGRVIYSSQKSAGAETSWCRGDPQPISDDDMIDGAINRIIADIRPDIAPYNTILRATVIEKTDGLPEDTAKAFTAAVKSAGKGDLSEACRAWGEIDRTNPSHPWTVYNLGVCAEANGNFAGALSLYEKARQLSPKADNDVAESITRVSQLIAAQVELRHAQKPGTQKPKR